MMVSKNTFSLVIKRAMDITIALVGIMLLWPVILFISLIIFIFMGRPVFFHQRRPGLHGKPFTIIKFRTMENQHDNEDSIRSDAERLTRLGRLLRLTSLDELPELWNVLKGDMSLVGPRPLLMEYLALYSSQQVRRHEVKPGLTGWAQVNGRNAISWEDKFILDVWYVDNHSFWLDMKIIFLSVRKVISQEGISAKNDVTMYKFKGNKE